MKPPTSSKFIVCGKWFTLSFVSHLSNGYRAILIRDSELLIRRNLCRQETAELLAAFVSGVWMSDITGKEFDYPPDGFRFGARHTRIELVSSRKLFPYKWSLEAMPDRMIVVNEPDRLKFVALILFTANKLWEEWRNRALKRALKHEKPVVDLSASREGPVSRKTAKPRVKPGELLPQAEREKMLAEGDAVLREMLGTPEISEPARDDVK